MQEVAKTLTLGHRGRTASTPFVHPVDEAAGASSMLAVLVSSLASQSSSHKYKKQRTFTTIIVGFRKQWSISHLSVLRKTKYEMTSRR